MPEITEYKENKLITLNPGEKYPFSFGLSKAKMILANIDAIKIFVDTDGQSCEKEPDINSMLKSDSGEPDVNLPF